MPETPLEERLAALTPGEPAPSLRGRLLARGRQRKAARRRGRLLQGALGFVAGALIAINLAFGHLHEQRLTALTGRSAVERTLTLTDLDLDRREPSMLLLARERSESRWLDD